MAFPDWRLPSWLRVLRPHGFTADVVSRGLARALTAVNRIARRSGRAGPRFSVDDVLDLLCARYGADEAVTMLRR